MLQKKIEKRVIQSFWNHFTPKFTLETSLFSIYESFEINLVLNLNFNDLKKLIEK